MTIHVDVHVTGEQETAALLERLSRRLRDGTPALYGLVDTLMEAQAERFAGRGTRWRRLSPSAIREHRRHGRGPAPLVLTGALRRSLTVRGAPNQIVRVTPTTLRFGTSVWYAQFAHKGIGEPRRTVVGLSQAQRKHAVAELRSLLLEDQ